MLIIAIVGLINGSFWAILVTEKLNVPPENLARSFPSSSRPWRWVSSSLSCRGWSL
jgi:hypothetical protein